MNYVMGLFKQVTTFVIKSYDYLLIILYKTQKPHLHFDSYSRI